MNANLDSFPDSRPPPDALMGWSAGFHSRHRGRPSASVERFGCDGDEHVFIDCPVAVVRRPRSANPRGRDLCAIAGRVFGLTDVARELGLPAERSPEDVLMAGFRRFGPDVLARLRGAFALVLWDQERRCGLVGQDLTALSAVFVKQTADGTAFAREIRDLLRILPSRPAPDPEAIGQLLAGSHPLPGHTVFSGIMRLQGGTCLMLEPESARLVKYWSPRYEGTLRLEDEDLTATLHEQVGVAVERAVGGAEKAGVLLSGGLDSSIVACVAAERGVDVRGYSAIFPQHPELDESRYVSSVASRWGIPVTSRPVLAQGGFSAALSYLDAWQVPLLGIGYVLERELIRTMAQDGPMAVLDGQGGDELFGPSPLLPADLLRRGRLLRSLQVIRTTPGTSTITSTRTLLAMWRRAALRSALPLALIEARERRHAPPPTPPWLVSSARQRFAESLDEWSWRRRTRGPLWWRWLSYLLLVGPAVGGRADYIRHRSALGGLVGGSPLLDFDLAALMLRMPPELAYDQSIDRPLARRSMEVVLPAQVARRREKSDLFAFYRDVLIGPDLASARRILREPRCSIYEFVDRRYVEPLLENAAPADGAEPGVLVAALHSAAVLECWLREQEAPGRTAVLLEQVAETEAPQFGGTSR
jgi:asparagine synthase (glutamine-hydrolysing)